MSLNNYVFDNFNNDGVFQYIPIKIMFILYLRAEFTPIYKIYAQELENMLYIIVKCLCYISK